MSSPRLGATWEGGGVRFALLSQHATAVEVCLYPDADPRSEGSRIALEPEGAGVWSAIAKGIEPGTGYGFRVDGPADPTRGHRFNPSKLLIDPYARAIAGNHRWHESLLSSSAEDSAPFVPRCLVTRDLFDWGDDSPPLTSWADTLIYECHVKGMTRLHPEVPVELRGTYLGLIQEPVLAHLQALGVTALELMPVLHFASERHLAERGASNYWGYSPLSFFAPHSGYATTHHGQQVAEFQQMVKGLHRVGIEVILDVVFNHTAEGGADGPTLGLRGIDNATYYRLRPDDPSRYVDFTGCGNTLNLSAPAVHQLILDSLRFWVEDMHVDGFRFDLATSLGRSEPRFSRQAPLFQAIAECSTLSGVKLIAEPWDLGPAGYRAGEFPEGWREWNDRYRDSLRRYWRGDRGETAELATRLAGSNDLYARRTTGARTGINFITSHDGFTLQDLVSYKRKNNWTNRENNNDGHDHNLSFNWGTEGPTRDPDILSARERAKKNLLASLALSLGVPMLAHGDELGRSQRGNNNSYCQDNELSWIDWDLDAPRREFLAFTQSVFELRRRLSFLRRRGFFSPSEIGWLGGGGELSTEDWRAPDRHELGMLIQGTPEDPCAGAILLLNAGAKAVTFRLPRSACSHRWTRLLSTANSAQGADVDETAEIPGYSLAVFACSEGEAASAAAAP